MIEYIVWVDDYKTEWRNLNRQLHREDGPAVEYSDGTKEWYQNGNLHRADGPSVDRADGFKCWSLNGILHREDGPAREYPNGSKEWWLNGRPLTEREFNKRTKSLDGKIATIDGIDYTLKIV